MHNLQQIKTALSSILNNYQPDTEKLIAVFKLDMIIEHLSLLSWLKAQVLYPQFYLNFRDNSKKIASLGSVFSFSSPDEAENFIQNNDVWLVGGIKFNNEAIFVLPRILFEQQHNTLHIQFIISNQNDWENEKRELTNLLDELILTLPIENVELPIQAGVKKAEQVVWQGWVEKALQEIQQGHLRKVVLANETDFVTDHPLDARDFLAKSEQYNINCYHFLFAENTEEAFLGSSPERLYQRNKQSLVTEAVAGTAIITDNYAENEKQATWLLNDTKNVYENWLVAQDIEQNLLPYTENITIQEKEIKQLRKVQHLKRRITATLKLGYSDRACLEAIHPTAAVAGLPKKKSKAFIQRTETFDRNWYAGTLGIMKKDYAEFAVTIRSAIIKNQNIRVFSGAGIVEGSVPLLEWQEIERKALGLILLLQKE